ncbi:hypothetical protein GM182_01170 [bacterium 3DAC]|nr:hypothetical protein GM182_01170 [bacterium 3DAC]
MKALQNILIKHYDKILTSFHNAWNQINMNNSEPNIIFNFLKNGISLLNKDIAQGILNKANFTAKFAGVFTHQKPIVEFYGNYRCELGDLLTLYIVLDKKKQILFNRAFISQAKKTVNDIRKNPCQTLLYDKARYFFYYRFKNLRGQKRYIPSYPTRILGLNYLVLLQNYVTFHFIPYNRNYIYYNNCCNYYKCKCKSSKLLCTYENLMFNTLMGIYGLSFNHQNKAATTSGWSRIILDLISETGKSTFGSKGKRGSYLQEFINYFNDFDNYDKIFIEAEGKEGIPILFIIVKSND